MIDYLYSYQKKAYNEILNSINRINKGYLFLVGAPGMGKTAILDYLIHSQDFPNTIFTYFTLLDLIPQIDKKEIFKKFFYELYGQLLEFPELQIIINFQLPLYEHLNNISNLSKVISKKFIIILDELDMVYQLNRSEARMIRDKLLIRPEILPDNIIFLLSGRKFNPKFWYSWYSESILSKLINIEMEPFEIKDIKELIEQHFDISIKNEDELLLEVLKVSSGNPLICKIILNQYPDYKSFRKGLNMDFTLEFIEQNYDFLTALPLSLKRKELYYAIKKIKTEGILPIVPKEMYEAILLTCFHIASPLEDAPMNYSNHNESLLRDLFLIGLNAVFEGSARREGFTKHGRADIIIRINNINILIIECKIWRGEKSLLKAIDQIFKYTVHRDTKTAIFLFNKASLTSYATFIGQINDIMINHNNHISDLIFDNQNLQQNYGDTYRHVYGYIFNHPQYQKKILLTVMAFHIQDK